VFTKLVLVVWVLFLDLTFFILEKPACISRYFQRGKPFSGHENKLLEKCSFPYIWNRNQTAWHCIFLLGHCCIANQLFPFEYCQEHCRICTVNGGWKQIHWFLLDLKLLLNSGLWSSTAKVYFTVTVAMHSDKLEKCVKLPFQSWSFHTWSLLSKDLMWSNRLWTKLSLLCSLRYKLLRSKEMPFKYPKSHILSGSLKKGHRLSFTGLKCSYSFSQIENSFNIFTPISQPIKKKLSHPCIPLLSHLEKFETLCGLSPFDLKKFTFLAVTFITSCEW